MGVGLEASDISLIAHRLPPSEKVKDRMIVKFSRREKRDEIYSKRKNLKSKRTKDLPSIACETESDAVSHKVQIHVKTDCYLVEYYSSSVTAATSLSGRPNGKILLKKSEISITNSFTTHKEFDEFLDGQRNL